MRIDSWIGLALTNRSACTTRAAHILVLGCIDLSVEGFRRRRAGEQVSALLGNGAEYRLQAFGVEVADIDVVDRHRAGGYVQWSADETDARGFPASGSADDRRGATRSGVERYAFQHRTFGPRMAECDVAEGT